MPTSEEQLKKREDEVARKEKELREFADLKSQWSQIKSKSAANEKRLVSIIYLFLLTSL